MHKCTKPALVCLLSSAMVFACERSNPPTNTDGGTTSSTPYASSGVNGGLSGEIWSAAAGTRLNLDTGEIKHLSEGQVFPSIDGREYAELISEFQYYPTRGCGGAPASSNAIFIRDSVTDEVDSAIEVLARLSGPVVLSPDGKTLALFASGSDICGDQSQYFATLMTRDGQVIATGSEQVVGFDWLPDNRLAFMIRDNTGYKLVVESEANSFTGVVSADLSELDGFASRFRVSPDGSQVLIEVVTELPPTLAVLEYREATVWQANIDGSNLRKIADTSRLSSSDNTSFADPLVNQPVWSPDGSDLLITENYSLGASIVLYGSETENLTYVESVSIAPVNQDNVTYAMPANSELQRLPPTSYSSAGVRPLFARDAQGKNNVLGINPIGRQVWTPAVANSVYAGGAFPATNGRTNRGLAGALYTYTSVSGTTIGAPLTTIELSSDARSVVGLNAGSNITAIADFDVSTDRQRIVALHTESFESGLVNLYNASGLLLESYAQATGNYDYKAQGTIRISPADENLVAWSFRSASGDAQGVVVLDSATGRFVDVFDDREYNAFTFMPNGDLLLIDGSVAMLAISNSDGFESPTIAFVHPEYMFDVVAHPNGTRLAFSALGRIFTIDANGENLNRVTAPSNYHFAFPSWAPDGKALLFRAKQAESSSSSTYFVSAEARNVALYDAFVQNNIMQLSESSSEKHRIADRIIWR